MGSDNLAQLTKLLCEKPSDGVFVKIDYDRDELAITKWHKGKLEKLSDSLDKMLSAYQGAIVVRSKKNIRISIHQLNAALDVCAVRLR